MQFVRCSGEEVEVLHIDEVEKGAIKPFMLKGTFNRRPFKALIDTGYPMMISTKAHVDEWFEKQANLKPLNAKENYVGFSASAIMR